MRNGNHLCKIENQENKLHLLLKQNNNSIILT